MHITFINAPLQMKNDLIKCITSVKPDQSAVTQSDFSYISPKNVRLGYSLYMKWTCPKR